MVDHRSQGHPASRHEHQARRNDQGPKPSDFIKASGHQRRAEKAGHMTAADQAGPNVKKALPTGPSTYDGSKSLSFIEQSNDSLGLASHRMGAGSDASTQFKKCADAFEEADPADRRKHTRIWISESGARRRQQYRSGRPWAS